MFNVAVINLKDIIKYLVSLTVIIIVVAVLARFFSNVKKSDNVKEQIGSKIESIKSNSYLLCLDETIPNAQIAKEKTNTIEASEGIEKSSLIKSLLGVELRMAKEDVKKNNENNENEVTNNEETIEQEAPQEEINLANTELETEVVTQNPISENFNTQYKNIKIKNETSFTLTEDIMEPNISIENKNVVIFHTHTCESYTSSELYPYQPTGNFRTIDKNYSVVKVGDELTKYLTEYNINVIHDNTYHDYPAYTGSYNRSLQTVQNILKTTSSDIVIDLHRDAIGSRSDYAPTVRIGEDYAAQMMFVVGTNGGGLWHPNWQQNLKFAIKVQEKGEELYPGLFKPIILRNSRYNQHVSKAATIIEVGATGNTLEQCLTSMKYLSKILNDIM